MLFSLDIPVLEPVSYGLNPPKLCVKSNLFSFKLWALGVLSSDKRAKHLALTSLFQGLS